MFLVTQNLVKNIVNTPYADLPENVLKHAKKSIVNWLGVAIGASTHPSVEMALALKEDVGAVEQVSILGRKEKADILLASLINGMASHIFDFDDTHLETIHHPSGPVAPVIFALGEQRGISAKKLLRAFILGMETELRIAKAVYPSHYDLGWHITSSTGVFGAAVASGILLDLNQEQMSYALGLAGTQAFGFREMFGTMTKPFHPGKAAQNGLLSSLLAKRGFTSSKHVLEAKKGFVHIMAPQHDLSVVNANWGEQWEILKNTFKPFACGIVLHPIIEACISLREKADIDEVQEIHIEVNPYVMEMAALLEPKTGLQGKFSIYHTAAAAFMDGDASEEQYSDEKVVDPRIVSFSKKINPVVNPSLAEDAARAKLILKNGREFFMNIEHAMGSHENPMGDEDLIRKFNKLTAPIISSENANMIIKQIFQMEILSTIHDILPYCTKSE